MDIKNMHSDHRARMYNRVEKTGLEGFYDHEALEYLLYFALPRLDTNPIAHSLIDRFGSFSQVLEADEAELLKVDGIGPNCARYIHSILLFIRYYQKSKSKKEKYLNSCEKLIEFSIPLFTGLTAERMYLLCMDDSFRLLGQTLICEGSVNSLNVPIRKIAETAIRFNATNIVLVHNHPLGIAVPSSEDIAATKFVKEALKPLDITVADHIIVSGNEGVSLFETNRM